MATPRRFERPTYALGKHRSILLSYGIAFAPKLATNPKSGQGLKVVIPFNETPFRVNLL
jgi:hypothetical protein